MASVMELAIRTHLFLCLAILAAAGIVAAAIRSPSSDIGTRLHRECQSIARAAPIVVERSGLEEEDFVQACIWRRAGPAGTAGE